MRTFSPITRYRIRMVLLITAFWIVLGIWIEVNNAIGYDPDTGTYGFHFPFGENVLGHLLITAVGPLIGGLVGGSIVVFVLRERLRRRPFLVKQFLQSLIFIAIICLLIMLVGVIQAARMPGGIAENFPDVILTLRAARNLVTWFVVVILTLILLDVNEKYGQGVLRKLITGRYHRPVAEERIFLFMDLVGSTPAAERLGDQKFFDLLSAVYFDATESILNTEGEVSGYVGDEIIISWSLKDGLRNGNCLHCFFSVTDILEARKDFYLKEFDVIPAFRGAVHLGTVTAGEIGVIKKDIMYAGDVLNSTERILGLAKKYDVRLLISASVHDRLHNLPGFAFTLQDTLILRGRKTESMIYRVARMPADVS